MKNYNHSHVHSGSVLSSRADDTSPLTVGELRDALAEFPDDAEIHLEGFEADEMWICGFKTRGPKSLGIRIEVGRQSSE